MSIRDRYSTEPHITLIEEMIKKSLLEINTISPGKVASYDPATGLAKVQPLNKVIYEDGVESELPALDDIPVCFFGSPKSTRLTHSVQPGDTGLLLSCQRSIDEFKAATKASPKETAGVLPAGAKNLRKFNINDSLFFPIYFSGDEGFSGLKDEAANSELGVRNKKIALKGAQTDVTEVLSNQQSQISSLQRGLQTVASSSPFTAPSSSPFVAAENIISKIKTSVLTVKQKLSFVSDDEALLRSITAAGLKVLGAVVVDGVLKLKKQTAEDVLSQQSEEPALEVSLTQRKLVQSTWFNYTAAYGWSIPGLNEAHSWFPKEGVGKADFSALTTLDRKDLGITAPKEDDDLIWGDLVSVILYPYQIGKAAMGLYWLRKVDLNLSSVRGIRLFVSDLGSVNSSEKLIGFYPVLNNVSPITGTPLFTVRLDVDLTNNNVGAPISVGDSFGFSSQSGFWGSFFGTDNDLEYPFVKLKFYDKNDKIIVAPGF